MRHAAFFIAAILTLAIIGSAGMGQRAQAQADSGYETENVFIVIIDGARYSETFGDANHTNIPRIWGSLRPNGTIDTGFYNRGAAKTVPGHASAVTGTWQYISNDGTQRPAQQTIFEIYRKQTGATAKDVWIVAGKPKIDAVAYSMADGYGSSYGASAVTIPSGTFYAEDEDTWEEVQEVMDRDHPSLMLVNLAEVDGDGHSGNWSDYVDAIRDVDEIVYDLWQKIQGDSQYRGKTTMIVTNDHGRHLNGTSEGWPEHGYTASGNDCTCDGCQHLMFLAIGPDVKVGQTVQTGNALVDIPATIGALFGLEMPPTFGEIMLEVLTHAPPEDTPDTDGGDGGSELPLGDYFFVIPLAAAIGIVAVVLLMRRKGGGKAPATAPSQAQPVQAVRVVAVKAIQD